MAKMENEAGLVDAPMHMSKLLWLPCVSCQRPGGRRGLMDPQLVGLISEMVGRIDLVTTVGSSAQGTALDLQVDLPRALQWVSIRVPRKLKWHEVPKQPYLMRLANLREKAPVGISSQNLVSLASRLRL